VESSHLLAAIFQRKAY